VTLPSGLEVALFAILIASIILHEVSHGAVALALGDDTAKRAGRLTLNPIPHIDPVGSILLPGVLLLTHAPLLFGWAKPVPVNTSRLRHPRNDAVVTGLAGPATNLVLVGFAIVLLRAFHPTGYWPLNLLAYVGLINLLLACFNLLPIPPLDGSSVVERFVPARWWNQYLAIRPYTMLLVLGVVLVGHSTNAYANAVNWLVTQFSRAAGYG
jgi:Zn-dependent protease